MGSGMREELRRKDGAVSLSDESLERVTSCEPVKTMEEFQLRAAWDAFSAALRRAESTLPQSVSTDFRIEEKRKSRVRQGYFRAVAAVVSVAAVTALLVVCCGPLFQSRTVDSVVPEEVSEHAVWDSWDAGIDSLAYDLTGLDAEEQLAEILYELGELE